MSAPPPLSPLPPLLSWTAGRLRVTRIVELTSTGGTRFILPAADRAAAQAVPWLAPAFADAEGRLVMTIHALVIETPSRRILVDTGLGNGKQGREVAAWNDRTTPFLDALAAAGTPAESIDTVICTHLHVDHVGWNTLREGDAWVPTFPQARHWFGRAEYDHWAARPPVHFQDSVAPVVKAGLADFYDADSRIAEEITLLPTPGHSPGHFSLLLRSQGESLLLTGDAAHHPIQLARPELGSTVDHDPAQAVRSRLSLLQRFADTETEVIGGHFAGGRIRRDGEAFRLTAPGGR
jgi:glyoxylase-like metal-dependent hydrolase (beta-lactamase superfamily II)